MSDDLSKRQIVFLLGIAGLVFGVLIWNEFRPHGAAVDSAAAESAKEHVVYAGQSTLTYKFGGDRDVIAAIASPFLPRNDDSILAAISALAYDAWGVRIGGLPAIAEDQEIVIRSEGVVYRAFPIKQDNGKVHSIRVRRTR